MTEHVLAAFYQALGHRVWTRFGVLWIDVGRFTLITAPANVAITVSRKEIQQLLCESGRLAAVFASTSDVGVECLNFWVRDKAYSLKSLQAKFRANVVRNSHRFMVRQMPWGELQERGLAVHRSTMERRGLRSHPSTSAAGWSGICAAGEKTAGLEVTGCFLGEVLTGFMVSWTHRNVCYSLSLYDDRSHSNLKASNVLAYNYTSQMISRPGIVSVSMGRDWWPPVESKSRFKRHAGYGEEKLSLAVILHPRWSAILESSFTRNVLRKLDNLTGHRIPFLRNLQLLDSAAATRL
jgi:hypothetical protein